MLLTNRFSFFNKKGDNLNPEKRQATIVRIVDDAQFPGIGAIINAYTNISGSVIYVEILDGGSNYGPNTYIEILSIDNENLLYTIPNSEITIGIDGDIQNVNIPASLFNSDFPYPSIYYFIDYSLERVSTGLVAVDQIYMLENVFLPSGKSTYTYPRVEGYGPFSINSFSANGTSAKIEITNYAFTGNVKPGYPDKIFRVPASVINDLGVGMTIEGTGVPKGTVIYSIDTNKQIVTLTNLTTGTGDISFTAYYPHELSVGSKISITGGALSGDDYELTQVDDLHLYFNSSQVISTTPGTGVTYKVTPKYRVFLDDSSDPSFFLFNVNYDVDYPVIEQTKSIEFEFTKAVNDTLPSGTNSLYQRTVQAADIQKTPFAVNIGHMSDAEGVFVGIINITDITFTGQTQLLFTSVYRAETEGEDERLGLLLENIGRDVDSEQELILRDSEVDESNVDYILLNQKRKEMLLMGDQIWPYLGSYRGLVNMVNWFGYYDIRLKEYFLNINSMDAEYGKYRQVPITFQLKDKKESGESLNLVPSRHYKKTSLFGLFYDIVRDSGEFDTAGIPITQDAFEFTNDEALVKFFALKRYLKEKFLPLNAQIVDITGEGVYYERYALNTWNDQDVRRVLELTRPVSFTCEDIVPIEDLRPYSNESYLSPTLEKDLQKFLNKYDILDITITNPGGPYTAIPLVTFPGTSNQEATGYVKMKGYVGSYTLTNPAGTNYVGGEIITLSGGTFDSPLRLVVTATSAGAVTDVSILSGYYQGEGYRSFPQSFGQALVIAAVGSQYETVSRSGFTASPSDLGFEIEDVIFLNKGLGYSTLPQAVFTPNTGSPTADLDLRITGGTPVGNINNGNPVAAWNDAPNIPVGGIASLSTKFDITWDEIPYSWKDVSGSTDASVKVHINPLPAGSGQVIAAEILNPGTDYTYPPTVQVVSNEGNGATISASLREGKLNRLEYKVTAVTSVAGGTNNRFTVTPNIASLGSKSVSINRLVTATGINDIVLTTAVTTGVGSTITIENYDTTPASTTVSAGDIIYVHEGVEVTNAGAGYSSVPGVKVNSGHTRSIFTWNNLGRGEFYQMQWKVILQEPEKPNTQFSYDSGIKNIDLLEDHTVILPYTGKYTVEMIVYNTDNNFANLVKKNCIKVYMKNADFSYISKFLYGCVDDWDSLKQMPSTELSQNANSINNINSIPYKWENATGRWVNPNFNNTPWKNLDFRWDNLDITSLSNVNNYNFPFCEDFPILEVSPVDNLEGPVVDYLIPPAVVNPTIVVQGQRSYPELEAAYTGQNEWIYIRRDDVIYQLDVLDADYSTPGYTYIELTSVPPTAFTSSPTTWEVLREIGGTIILSGNRIYDEQTNPTGIAAGEYVKVFQKNQVPINSRIPINAKNTYVGQPSSITLNGEGGTSALTKKGEIGKIYKLRDGEALNGNLVWDPVTALSTWVISSVNSNDPEIRDSNGKLYIRKSATNASPLSEIRPGFTTLRLYAYLDDVLQFTQDFRTTHVTLNTSTVGDAYDIWNDDVYEIDIKGINGGPIDELTAKLLSLASAGIENVYLEYVYNEFPTRTYFGQAIGGNMDVYFDFNMFPAGSAFVIAPATDFDSTAISNHTNWFFDNGVDTGDFSIKVTQVGLWQGGVGTILTLDDNEYDLYRISSSFSACQRDFDEDAAERRLGTDVITWKNYQDVVWEDSCGLSWNTLDYSIPYWCNFTINNIVQNSGLSFNEDDPYYFDELVGGMNNAEIYSQSLYELNNLTTGGLAKFAYSLIGSNYIEVAINTYEDPNGFTVGGGVAVNDVIYGNPFAPASKVTSVAGNFVTLNKNLNKKATFIGDCVAGKYKITNIQGLQVNSIGLGDIISSSSLPSYPAAPATVTNILTQQGMVRELTLSLPLTSSGDDISFDCEWTTSTISAQLMPAGGSFKIVASAKTPGVDCLGYLAGEFGLTFETPDNLTSAISHTFPTGNFYSWFGFGENKIGAFLNGLYHFSQNYRNIQTYITEGIDPFGNKGWYPAENLPYQYSYTNSPYMINNKDAKAQAERLPYERSIGGALTWEETWSGQENVRIPIGSSVIFTSDTSRIVGKTKYLWKIKDGETLLVETIDPMIMWNFNIPGKYDIELTIEDTNGNVSVMNKKSYIEIYEAKES